jgi:uncharacterized cupredoxin-like copper-binding protein
VLLIVRRMLLGAGVALLGGVLAVGCGEDAAPEPVANAVTIEAADFSFTGQENLKPGTNRITLSNTGEQVHHLQFVKVEGERTLEEVMGGLMAMEEGGPPPDYISFTGGIGQIAPGTQAGTVENLAAGNYLILCFVPDPTDGLPHAAKGMAAMVAVQGETNTAPLPAADVEIGGVDYAFTGADQPLSAGEITLKLTNQGTEPHEANVLRLAEGATIESIAAWFQAPGGPPPFANVGGAQGIMPGASTLAVMDLEAGNYLLICFIPNAEGVPHALLGMVKPFAVQ